MSTNRKRLNKAIQDIAKEAPEIRKLLDDFRNSGGKPSESATTGSGAEDRQICCDGSTGSGGATPGSDTRDPTDGDQDGLDPDDPANLSGLDGGCLTGVTDCANGDPICFCGDDFIPPEGWEEPNEPPPDSSYTEGMYYQAGDAKGATLALLESDYVARYPNTYVFCGINCNGDFVCISMSSRIAKECDPPDAGSHFPDGYEYISGQVDAPTQKTCDGSTADYCNPDPEDIAAGQWPSDGCTNLAIKSGTIVGSKYDPENDGSYSAPRNSIDLCDGSGNQISLAPSADGGWKTINSTTDNGYLYNSKGEQIAHIDGNEYSDPSV